MRVLTTYLVAIGIVAGLVGAAVGYRAVTATPDQRPAAAQEQLPQAKPAPKPQVRLLPCERGWTQHGRACVRVVTKTVDAGGSAGVGSVPPQVVQTRAVSRPVHRAQASEPQQTSGSGAQEPREPSDDGGGSGDAVDD